MSDRDSGFTRRWAARRATGATPAEVVGPADDAVLSGAMNLLSDYEDAIYAMCRHALLPAGASPATEAAHLVEATQLHADVRRLRGEVLALIDPTAADPGV